MTPRPRLGCVPGSTAQPSAPKHEPDRGVGGPLDASGGLPQTGQAGAMAATLGRHGPDPRYPPSIGRHHDQELIAPSGRSRERGPPRSAPPCPALAAKDRPRGYGPISLMRSAEFGIFRVGPWPSVITLRQRGLGRIPDTVQQSILPLQRSQPCQRLVAPRRGSEISRSDLDCRAAVRPFIIGRSNRPQPAVRSLSRLSRMRSSPNSNSSP